MVVAQLPKERQGGLKKGRNSGIEGTTLLHGEVEWGQITGQGQSSLDRARN